MNRIEKLILEKADQLRREKSGENSFTTYLRTFSITLSKMDKHPPESGIGIHFGFQSIYSNPDIQIQI